MREADLHGAVKADPVEGARRFLGTPYVRGGLTERVIDCSGLVHILITYAENGETKATHIAFWLGDGRILHSTQRDGVDGV